MKNTASLARQSLEHQDYLDAEALSFDDPDRRWEFGGGAKCAANDASIEPTVIIITPLC